MSKADTSKTGELYCDTRLGGVKRWYYGKPKDADMRIPDEILHCVCFLAVKVAGERGESNHFIGTGFFVNLPPKYGPPGRFSTYTYLVTASHVIEGAKRQGYDQLYVRLNTRDGQSEVIPIPDDWEYHKNPANDVAVMPFHSDQRQYEYTSLSTLTFIDDDEINLSSTQIGIGDELLITGLFVKRWGYRKNIPIVRSGIIAAMTGEPFISEGGELYDAYLAEIRSIGGLSGSPVFIVFPPGRMLPNHSFYHEATKNEWRIDLLGLIRGHWNLEEEELANDANRELEQFNAGIAKVTPIQTVQDILFGEVFMKQREEDERRNREKNVETLDSAAPSPKARPVGEMTAESFEEALRSASRKTSSQPDSESD